MASIRLPKSPTSPSQVEDCVSALFNASGYHVDRSMHHRDRENVLELDAVATDYSTSPPTRMLVEAKSGGWGYPDLFKVLGWMQYLGFEKSVVVVTTLPKEKDIEKINARMNPYGLRVVHLDVSQDIKDQFKNTGLATAIDPHAYIIWQYVYAQERAFVNYLRGRIKGEPGLQGPREVINYYRMINDEIFFQPDEYERLRGLYQAFMEHPKLSLGVAREVEGGVFDCSGVDPRNSTIGEAIYHGRHDLLQACFYVEQRARLAILKAAVDLEACARKPKPMLLLGEEVAWTEYDFLPASFRSGVEDLRKEKHFALYPLFWQVFTWVFGGFILEDRTEQEYGWLEALTGVPNEHVDDALGAFDKLFDKGSSWVYNVANSGCTAAQRSGRIALKSVRVNRDRTTHR